MFCLLSLPEALLWVDVIKMYSLFSQLPISDYRFTPGGEDCWDISFSLSSMLPKVYSRQVQPKDMWLFFSTDKNLLLRQKLYPRCGRLRILGPDYPPPNSFIRQKFHTRRGKMRKPGATSLLSAMLVKQGCHSERRTPLPLPPESEQWRGGSARGRGKNLE